MKSEELAGRNITGMGAAQRPNEYKTTKTWQGVIYQRWVQPIDPMNAR